MLPMEYSIRSHVFIQDYCCLTNFRITFGTLPYYSFTFYLDFFFDFDQTWLYIWVTRRVSYKKQELFTLCEHLSSPRFFGGVRVAHLPYVIVLSYYVSLRS